MKKILCVILALVSIMSLAACSGKPEEQTAPQTNTNAIQWPDNAFFKDIPSVGDTITFYEDNKNEQGYTYTFFADDMTYGDFRAYVAKLEEAGFSVYKESLLSTITTEDMLPEKLDEGTYNASWIGNRRGVYIAAQWYGDEYYEQNNLPQDSNVRLVFYTYNAFAQ